MNLLHRLFGLHRIAHITIELGLFTCNYHIRLFFGTRTPRTSCCSVKPHSHIAVVVVVGQRKMCIRFTRSAYLLRLRKQVLLDVDAAVAAVLCFMLTICFSVLFVGIRDRIGLCEYGKGKNKPNGDENGKPAVL